MTRALRFGLVFTDEATGPGFTELAKRVEQDGFSTLLVADHLHNPMACGPLIMAAAAATSTLRVGSYVYNNDFREAPQTQPYDPEPRREQLRGILALAVVGLLSGTVLLSFVAIWLDWTTAAEMQDLLSGLFPPLVALAGSALGFYFGGRTR